MTAGARCVPLAASRACTQRVPLDGEKVAAAARDDERAAVWESAVLSARVAGPVASEGHDGRADHN